MDGRDGYAHSFEALKGRYRSLIAISILKININDRDNRSNA